MLGRRLHALVVVASAVLLAAGCTGTGKKKTVSGPSYDNLMSEVKKPNNEPLEKNPFTNVSTGGKKKNPFQTAWDKASTSVGKAFTPKPKKALDATSLSNSPARIPAEVHLSAGRLMENQGRTQKAIEQYEAALVASPTHLTALISLARLYDRGGDFTNALRVYEMAVAAYPDKPLIHNDLGLCYARQGKIDKSLKSLTRAVDLEPNSKKYRNNIATVLVEGGRVEDAHRYLLTTHPEHVARYNLAFLLNRRKERAAALRQLDLALQADANFTPAQELMRELGGQLPRAAENATVNVSTDQSAADLYELTPARVQDPVADNNQSPREDFRYSEDDELPRLLPPVVDLK